MADAKWTPGPWRMIQIRSGEPDEWGEEQWGELAVRGPKLNEDDNPYHQIADCGDPDNNRAVANARLIAAAPELLEALLDPLDETYFVGMPQKTIRARSAARATIAKATGTAEGEGGGDD